jgi:hypothetical protein
MKSQKKYDNLSKEERDKKMEEDRKKKLAMRTASIALKAAKIANNARKAGTMMKKLSSGPAGLIILIIVVILENVLKLDVEDFKDCDRGEYDLMSLPGYVRTIIGMVPNLGDLFDLIGNKLCFKAGCAPNMEKQAGLCYKKCRPGYKAVGPVCWKRCENDIDVGALCRKRCRPGYKEVAGVCWASCPSGFTDIGALCSKPLKCNSRWNKCKSRPKIFGKRRCIGGLDTKCTGPETKVKKSYVPVTYPKPSYGRGIGMIPLNIRMKPRKDK